MAAHRHFTITHERAKSLITSYGFAKTTRISRSSVDQSVIDAAIAIDISKPLFQGTTSIIQNGCYLHFHLPADVYLPSPSNCVIVPYGWCMFFGTSITFSLAKKNNGFLSRVHVATSDPAYALLRTGQFTATFSKGGTLLDIIAFDFNKPDTLFDLFLDPFRFADIPSVRFADPIAHYWEVAGQLETHFEKHTSKADNLSHGWVSIYKKSIMGLEATLKQLQGLPNDQNWLSRFPVILQDYLRLLVEGSSNLPKIIRTAREQCVNNQHYFFDIYEAIQVSEPSLLEAGLNVAHLLFLFNVDSICTEQTAGGQRLPWINTRKRITEVYDIDKDRFPASFPPDRYWPRLKDNLHLNYGNLLTPSDVPIDPAELLPDDKKYPMADNIEDAMASAYALLDEATANKKWCIPPKAVVQLSVGPFEFFELTETEKEIIIVARSGSWEFYIFVIDPTSNHCCTFGLETKKNERENDDLRKRIKAGVTLLLSAVIRDFWVVEERERVFSTLKTNGKQRIRGAASDDPIVVYLPKIQYKGKPDLKKCEGSLDQKDRRSHFVNAHLRKSANPSPNQLILAEMYGFSVPQGYTFVKSHERGKKKREVIYRSRSALQSLYSVLEGDIGNRPDWFQFERDVYALMESMGFSVEHVSASVRGDNGVDVYATKGADFERVNWVIQCKCYRPSRKVGPSIVRELIGTLSGYPRGTRGMIVTTSSFSDGAIDEAKKHDIRTIDGDEFLRCFTSGARS